MTYKIIAKSQQFTVKLESLSFFNLDPDPNQVYRKNADQNTERCQFGFFFNQPKNNRASSPP